MLSSLALILSGGQGDKERQGGEYELMKVLNYKEWRKFENVIKKSFIACNNSNNIGKEHFVHAAKTIKMPKGASKEINDYKLTRYACYLIVQNADSRKQEVA